MEKWQCFLTWIEGRHYCSRIEVTISSFVLQFLKIAVECVGCMIPNCIGKVARLVWLYFAAVRTVSTSPVKSLLQFLIWSLFISYAPILKLCIWTTKTNAIKQYIKHQTPFILYMLHSPPKQNESNYSCEFFLPDFCGIDDNKITKMRNFIRILHLNQLQRGWIDLELAIVNEQKFSLANVMIILYIYRIIDR